MKLFTSIVTILVFLVIFIQVLISEARQLHKTDGQDHLNAGSTDNFTPTNPGNSPGIGHKKGNANLEGFKDDFKPTEGRKLLKTDSQDHLNARSIDDFTPTTPGHSPGMGHKKGNANLEGFKDDFKPKEGKKLRKVNNHDHFDVENLNDFAPTNPGNSPGMGHKKGNANVEGFRDDFKPTKAKSLQKTNNKDHFNVETINDFSPTNPGNSPGMGHKKGNANLEGFKDDSKSKDSRKFKKSNDQDHFKIENLNDFAPTNPGNSPGMGHKKGNANIEGLRDDFKPTSRGHSHGNGHAINNNELKA